MREEDKEKAKNKKDENKEREVWRFLSEFHQALIRNIHDYQRNFTQLLVAVIAGMAAFGYGAKVFLTNPCPQNAIFFGICTLASVILLLITIIMGNISAYQHRSLQGVMWKIEEEFGVTKDSNTTLHQGPQVVPATWNPFKEPIDAPEVYNAFKQIAISLIIISLGLFFAGIFFFLLEQESLKWASSIAILSFATCLTLCLGRNLFRRWLKCDDFKKALEKTYKHLDIKPRGSNKNQ